MHKFHQLLNTNFKEITTIIEYAGQLGITPNYLNIVVKEITGTSPTEFRNNIYKMYQLYND